MTLEEYWTIVGISMAISLAIITLALLVWSLIWVYRDAEARGKPGWAVALLVLFLKWPLSLAVWVIFRPDTPLSFEKPSTGS